MYNTRSTKLGAVWIKKNAVITLVNCRKAGLWVPNTINANVKNESLKVKVNVMKIIITFHVTGKLPLPKGGISVCFKVTIYLQLTQSPFTFNLLHLPFDTIKDMEEDYYQKNITPNLFLSLSPFLMIQRVTSLFSYFYLVNFYTKVLQIIQNQGSVSWSRREGSGKNGPLEDHVQ